MKRAFVRLRCRCCWRCPVLVWSQQPSELKPVTDQLAASIYTGPSMTTLANSTDGVGGRVTGSPSYVRSTEWAAAKFRSYGIENVRLEPFTIPAGWQRGSASGRMVAPLARPLYVTSLGWSPSTPAGRGPGTVVLVSDVAPDEVAGRGRSVERKDCVSGLPAKSWQRATAKHCRSWRRQRPYFRRRACWP